MKRAPIASSLPRAARPKPATPRSSCPKSSACAAPAFVRSPSQACTSARMAAISAGARRCCGCCETIERAPAGMRFRISSLEPMDCSDEIVELVAGSRHFAPHFHLPLQHASDPMLVAMRRPYTIAYYRRSSIGFASAFRTRRSAPTSSWDFPERRTRFEVLERIWRGSPMTHVHVFPYSDRPGTEATAMTRQGARVDRPRTRHRLRKSAAGSRAAFHRGQDGTIRPGLTIDDGRNGRDG